MHQFTPWLMLIGGALALCALLSLVTRSRHTTVEDAREQLAEALHACLPGHHAGHVAECIEALFDVKLEELRAELEHGRH